MGALEGIAGALGKGALDFGLGVATSAVNAKIARKLRRTEYQDMMHSMRQAGLNPMLASGATPGHSAVSMTQPAVDLPGNINSAINAEKLPKEKALLDAKEAEASQAANMHAAQEWGFIEAGLKAIQDVKLGKELTTKAQADSALAMAEERAALKKAGLYDANAKESIKRRELMALDQVQKQQDAQIMQGTEGEILRRLDAWSKALQGARGAVGAPSGSSR
ncbi:MAG: DNA pilot protein [Microvirus sp.]|nr:MAG: DNA pilot protein [Microvirus sp.]